MNIKVTGTRVRLTPAIKSYVIEKLGGLKKYLNTAQLCKVELEVKKNIRSSDVFRAEATIDAPHAVFRAESRADDMYAAIDMLVPKLIHQMQKVKDKGRDVTRKLNRRIKEEGF